MAKRKDALFAASKAICYLHEAIDALQIEDLVYTTGEIICHPCVHSCVPDEVEISIDVRHKDAESLQKAENVVKSLAERTWAGCACTIQQAWNRDTVYWNKDW